MGVFLFFFIFVVFFCSIENVLPSIRCWHSNLIQLWHVRRIVQNLFHFMLQNEMFVLTLMRCNNKTEQNKLKKTVPTTVFKAQSFARALLVLLYIIYFPLTLSFFEKLKSNCCFLV